MWEQVKVPFLIGYTLVAMPFVGIAVFAYLVVTRWM